ncbi:oxidoreductase [Arenicella chitinivorans]|uniref:Oxidoreductase n=1 Tax=Arenicella chitinivorans TaxID=1329800 RepID=A0A918VNJ9_9GAMM|nr:SDR family oxidoreductase [Arenicella chitinivorans]GHA11508.1 oxidoreductase [Arenicella chitinivorans]
MKLENKVILVTGGVRDIGREVSKKLAAEGAKLAINYFGSEAQAASLRTELAAMGAHAIILKGDMTSAADVEALVSQAVAELGGKIDGLVNVVGGLVERKTLDEMDLDFFEHVIKLNTTSTFLTFKAAVPHMSAGASIVNLASQAGRDGGGPGASAYATSKGAVMTFTRSMAKELGPQGIRVNALCPGMISTTFHDTFTNDNVRSNVANGTPLRREGRPEEVADTVSYLLSDEASFLTGVNLDINGGLLFS